MFQHNMKFFDFTILNSNWAPKALPGCFHCINNSYSTDISAVSHIYKIEEREWGSEGQQRGRKEDEDHRPAEKDRVWERDRVSKCEEGRDRAQVGEGVSERESVRERERERKRKKIGAN